MDSTDYVVRNFLSTVAYVFLRASGVQASNFGVGCFGEASYGKTVAYSHNHAMGDNGMRIKKDQSERPVAGDSKTVVFETAGGSLKVGGTLGDHFGF